MKNQLTEEVINLIDWREFFRFWKFTGNYPAVLQNPEAKKLFDDANNLLKIRKDFGDAKIEWFDAKAVGDDIHIDNKYVLRCFRQQTKKPEGEKYYCLSDFVKDKIGVFAITAGKDLMISDDDMYGSLLYNSVSQRIVEAFSQFYQKKHAALSFAIGFPSLPDMRVIRIADEILDFGSIGITLNDSCMMSPLASVCGFYIKNPQAKYFAVGKISDEQFADYAARGNESVEEVRKWVR